MSSKGLIVKVQTKFQTHKEGEKWPRGHHLMVTVVSSSIKRAIELVEEKYGKEDQFKITSAALESWGNSSEVIVDPDYKDQV